MKQANFRTTSLVIGALFTGWMMGVSNVASSQAEETSPAPTVQGEVIKVCIHSKTGVIRAAAKCDLKNERKTVLGGTGAQGPMGPQGEKGDTGDRGPQGLTGQTGATGTVTGLRRTNITFLTADYGCPGYASSVRYVSDVSYNKYSTYTPIDVTTRTLRGCSADVYTP